MPSRFALAGIRVWLAAAVPDEAKEEDAGRVARFVAALAAAVFGEGAALVHGFHPSTAPPLLHAAETFQCKTLGTRAALKLVWSSYFRDTVGYAQIPLQEIQQLATLQEVPHVPGNRDESLGRLRDALAAQADVLIAVGGRWWEEAPFRAGIPKDIEIAISLGLPVFLLSALGSGAAAGYAGRHPEVFGQLRNGLDEAANRKLANGTNVEEVIRAVLAQIARLPLARRVEPRNASERFRILCLDGGGIRGAFTAAVLAKWESLTGRRAADHFDLVAGTSTGGLIAIGLGLGISAQELLNFYTENGPEIFRMTGIAHLLFGENAHYGTNKYDASVLEEKFRIAFDRAKHGATLADSQQRLLIASYNLTANRLRLFRTGHHPSGASHDDLPAVTVARATSAAPTYFKAAKVEDRVAPYEAVDGGIWANCPATAAIGEAVDILNIPLERIDMLSIGAAALPPLVKDPGMQGKLGWAGGAPDLFLNAQIDATLRLAEQLLGPERFVRIDDPAPRVESLDDVAALNYLTARGASVAEEQLQKVKDRFLNGIPAASFRRT